MMGERGTSLGSSMEVLSLTLKQCCSPKAEASGVEF